MSDHCINLTGQRFGRLIVLDLNTKRSPKRDKRWNCLCDCGKSVVVATASLKGNLTRSCGCLQRDLLSERNSLPDGIAQMRHILKGYKATARRDNRSFELTEEQFKILIHSDCFYCGSPPSRVRHDKGLNSLLFCLT